ncbi:S-adenosylmethionine:tRNA ribosyltransferase-isomerase [Streptosporangium roseum]|uniref:S-adenosylmethionine:tRNA ribosyltransferase-isomerase n=1 Tax=Streptosporangium roseum TaxID=2001 RepID=UPI003438C208
MSSLKIDELKYDLPFEAIEGTPREIRLGRRDAGRLLVVDRATAQLTDSFVQDIGDWFRSGDVLVLNNSKRIPGILYGRTRRGGRVELRFVDFDGDRAGLCVIFPMHDIDKDAIVRTDDGTDISVREVDVTDHKLCRVEAASGSLKELLARHGRPIPGFFYDGHWTCDHLNPYYATEPGTVESPLAGLHFTQQLVEDLSDAGVEICFVTLHSVGSWLPFMEEDANDHVMWSEEFHVPAETAQAIDAARSRGSRVFACGSTSLRALESAAVGDGRVKATKNRTDLYITPSYDFKVVDAYFTNFHQYHTSLIVLDAAFAGVDTVKAAYRHARDVGYRFFEFGDAVLYIAASGGDGTR